MPRVSSCCLIHLQTGCVVARALSMYTYSTFPGRHVFFLLKNKQKCNTVIVIIAPRIYELITAYVASYRNTLHE
jgi:hypothetical protein